MDHRNERNNGSWKRKKQTMGDQWNERNNGDQGINERKKQCGSMNERNSVDQGNERSNGKIKWMGKSETMEGSKWTKETIGGSLNNNYFKQ